MNRIDERLVYGALVPAVVALDHTTKVLARSALDVGEPVSLLPFFNLALSFNRGVAFGLLNSVDGPVVLILTVAISGMFALWLWREPRSQTRLALALILGGALGNVLDRAVRGEVTDFLDIHAAGWHWPAFNLADASITLGAGLLFIEMLRVRRQEGA